MKPKIKKFDWIVIGGGVSGISISEILCRENHNVLLIEKNHKLASETSKVFHEWLHSGSLYSLVPDNLLTLRYLLGATDDLLEFYNSFTNMNLIPTTKGINVIENPQGWFNNQRIEYKFKLHKLNPIWTLLISRAINIIGLVSEHDWLRRRAGSEFGKSVINNYQWFSQIKKIYSSKDKFLNIISPDITMNSRLLISDLLNQAIFNGLDFFTGKEVSSINEEKDSVVVKAGTEKFVGKNLVICSPDVISNIYKTPLKIGYAPIGIVGNVPKKISSFVELDYYPKKCINLLVKENGIGQAGGITLNAKNKVNEYLDFVISEHKKRNPGLEFLGSYTGLKKELVNKGENRNYLFHIRKNSEKIWSIVLGKFSLAFSMAPEFYRRVYNKNPRKTFEIKSQSKINENISNTSWHEIAKGK